MSKALIHNTARSSDQEEPAITWSWQSIALLAATLVLTIGLMIVPGSWVSLLGDYGYVGVFVLTLLASASIVMPSPALGIAALAGKTLDPWLVGLSGGLAAGLGEITGYMAGRGGSPLVARSRFYPRVERWVQRYGGGTIFVLAFIPGPVFDLAGIAAGTMRMPVRRFLVACIAGKIARFILVAWLGHLLGDLEML